MDGVFESWTDWSTCSTTCGGGVTVRTRRCRAPLHGGSNCSGAWRQTDTCNTQPCPGICGHCGCPLVDKAMIIYWFTYINLILVIVSRCLCYNVSLFCLLPVFVFFVVTCQCECIITSIFMSIFENNYTRFNFILFISLITVWILI